VSASLMAESIPRIIGVASVRYSPEAATQMLESGMI